MEVTFSDVSECRKSNTYVLQRFSRDSGSSLTKLTNWLESNVNPMAKINCLQPDYLTNINQTDSQNNLYAEHGKHTNTGKSHSFILSGLFF